MEEDYEYEDDPFLEDFEEEEEPKPEPLSFPDVYSPPPPRPVELQVPGHSDAYEALRESKESRFPARRVARSAAELAKALRSASLMAKRH